MIRLYAVIAKKGNFQEDFSSDVRLIHVEFIYPASFLLLICFELLFQYCWDSNVKPFY